MIAVYPLAAVRRLILHSQALATANGAEPPPTPDAIHDMVARLGCIQIDTLQMIRRSQYVALWSRLGSYDPADLDRLAYGEPRRLFEDWMHAACILPLGEYRYMIPHQRWVREHPTDWFRSWVAEPGNAELLDMVLERVRAGGPLAVSDFEYNGPKRASWWDWKPVKHALEYRYAWGDLMIAKRVSFQRYYDLRERVLPAWVDTTEPSRPEMIRHILETAVRAFGACRPEQADHYYHGVKGAEARPYVAQMTSEGIFVPIKTQGTSGKERDLIVHRDSLPLLQQAADGALPGRRTTFLSPFDSLFWPMGSDVEIWGFRKSLEAYLPAAKRTYGYFCLPILHGERLIGRFDPKLERASASLRLKALYLEPGIAPDTETVAAVAGAMRDFLAFHAARSLLIERSEPADFGAQLLAAL